MQGATTLNSSSIFNAPFCILLGSDCYSIFRCCQKLKNNISLQFHINLFTKCWGKNRETYFWDDPRMYMVIVLEIYRVKYGRKNLHNSNLFWSTFISSSPKSVRTQTSRQSHDSRFNNTRPSKLVISILNNRLIIDFYCNKMKEFHNYLPK